MINMTIITMIIDITTSIVITVMCITIITMPDDVVAGLRPTAHVLAEVRLAVQRHL